MRVFFTRVVKEIISIAIPLYKILIPFAFLIKLLEVLGIIEQIATLLAPVTSAIGLTSQLGLVFVTAFMVNIYAALVMFTNLTLSSEITVAQITTLATMILIAHNVLVESAISRAAGVSFGYTFFLRIGSAIGVGFLLNFYYGYFDLLQTPFHTFLAIQIPPASLTLQFIEQIKTLIQIFIIICVMVTVLEFLKMVGIVKILEKILAPLLALFGIRKQAMNIIIVGLVIGLTFSGGILIKEVRSGKMDKQSAVLAIFLLNLVHALFEDTLLMSLMGAHISGILFARVFYGFIVSYFIFQIYSRLHASSH